MTTSVSAEVEPDGAGRPGIRLKIGAPDFEIDVALPLDEVERLDRVERTPWVGGALRIGRCAGAPAHWSVDDGRLTILVGQDDQCWDLGVTVAAALLPEIRAAVGRCRRDGTVPFGENGRP